MEVARMPFPVRSVAALPLLVLAAPAFAHPGHLAEQAGHGHWLALAAAAGAVAILVVAAALSSVRRRKAALRD
jgi:hypothetical protein